MLVGNNQFAWLLLAIEKRSYRNTLHQQNLPSLCYNFLERKISASFSVCGDKYFVVALTRWRSNLPSVHLTFSCPSTMNFRCASHYGFHMNEIISGGILESEHLNIDVKNYSKS